MVEIQHVNLTKSLLTYKCCMLYFQIILCSDFHLFSPLYSVSAGPGVQRDGHLGAARQQGQHSQGRHHRHRAPQAPRPPPKQQRCLEA